MALVAFGANRSAPGVTTAVLALGAVWARDGRQPLVVEADPDGGVLVARFGLNAHPNLTELAGRSRAGLRPTDAWDHAQALPGGLNAVVAHPSAEQTHAALRAGAARIGEHLAGLDHTDVLLDAGHLGPASPSLALLDSAALTVLVLRPRLDEITALAQRLPARYASTARSWRCSSATSRTGCRRWRPRSASASSACWPTIRPARGP